MTIATALAGRGTDVLLGGNPKGLVQMLLENRLLERLAGPGETVLGWPVFYRRARPVQDSSACAANLAADHQASGALPPKHQRACVGHAHPGAKHAPCLAASSPSSGAILAVPNGLPVVQRLPTKLFHACSNFHTDAGDLANFDRRLPLANLSVALLDLNEFDQLPAQQLASAAAAVGSVFPRHSLALPPEVCSAYCELRAALAAVLPEPPAEADWQLPGLPPPVAQNGTALGIAAALEPLQLSGRAGAAAAALDATGRADTAPLEAGLLPPPPPGLPWRRYGAGSNQRAAQHAADWLSQQVEAAEMQKAQLRCVAEEALSWKS